MWVLLALIAVAGATSLPEPIKKPIPPKPLKKCRGPNEKWVKCRTLCPPQSCDISYTTYLCPEKQKCESGCDCIKDHLRLKNGTCVKNDDCPPPTPEPVCGYNEVSVPCPQTCPPQDCEALYLNYLCAQKDDSVPCEPGCNCKENHLRNASKICVPVAECPPAPWLGRIKPQDPTNPVKGSASYYQEIFYVLYEGFLINILYVIFWSIRPKYTVNSTLCIKI
ncbi:uncharacterized protein LOC113229234 [Hyposmocoma kahamanoa]|uniref:uncharacterized protein LOC113229234 n=1 Tax=Hyposmocoma kahamanoa TaxID=1477025 RepID=UPI000E6D6C00|nr:uncharacterized protein LOC113229234 [Hyposmocoma kahamanoa]